MRIFLCGMMGAGKTTIGKKIANQLKIPFVDLDKSIEAEEGRSIIEIFSKHGEAYFRDLETKYLTDLINKYPNAVFSLGGGTPCFNQNIELINQNGISVFINVGVEKLVNRLWYAKTKRPLTQNMKSPEELRKFLTNKLEERLPFYQKCLLCIDNSTDDIKKIIQQLNTTNFTNT